VIVGRQIAYVSSLQSKVVSARATYLGLPVYSGIGRADL
jgi:hypothetical protein